MDKCPIKFNSDVSAVAYTIDQDPYFTIFLESTCSDKLNTHDQLQFLSNSLKISINLHTFSNTLSFRCSEPNSTRNIYQAYETGQYYIVLSSRHLKLLSPEINISVLNEVVSELDISLANSIEINETIWISFQIEK